jgi:ribonuclease III
MDDSNDSASETPVTDKVRLCQERIGYVFKDPQILFNAITHASGAPTRLHSNERLEFLGDSILGLVVCQRLFEYYPEYLEGDLTKVKSVVVSRRVCAKIARQLQLEECLIVGKGMMSNSGIPRSLLSDVFEAIVAAVYLDAGMEFTRNWLLRWLDPEIQVAVDGHPGGNYKSTLQQIAQRDYGGSPQYVLINEQGPDHSKYFQIAVQVDGTRYTAAWGRNKKDAEQRAAGNALAEMRGEDPPYEHR